MKKGGKVDLAAVSLALFTLILLLGLLGMAGRMLFFGGILW